MVDKTSIINIEEKIEFIKNKRLIQKNELSIVIM